jgi:hypothetical protein
MHTSQGDSVFLITPEGRRAGFLLMASFCCLSSYLSYLEGHREWADQCFCSIIRYPTGSAHRLGLLKAGVEKHFSMVS